MSGVVRRLEHAAGLTAPTQWLYSRWYERRFRRAGGFDRRFRGIYDDFATATAAAPPGRPLGYDNEATASLLLEERHRIHDSDYPILFWLSRLLRPGSRIFDLGGNVGISFYAYRPFLPLIEDCRWIVYDVPAVVRAGAAVLASDPAPALSFTSSLEPIGGCDVLLAAGALQFIEDPWRLLGAAEELPTHVLLNKTPIYTERSAVTLQATGSSFCPYHLFNREDLLKGFAALGHDLVHEWQNPNLGCHIPTFPRHSIGAYSGMYLRRNLLHRTI